MDPDKNAPDEKRTRDDSLLPIIESPTIPSTIKPANSADPASAQDEPITDAAHKQPAEETHRSPEPLFVRIIEDDKLSTFERQTVVYGKVGIFVAFLALVAACVTAYFIYEQFKATEEANQLAGFVANKARYEARASDRATAQQLSIIQKQLDAARVANEINRKQWQDEHRPFLGPDGAMTLKGQLSIKNYGLFPATRVMMIPDSGNGVSFRIHDTWKNTDNCMRAAELSSQPDYYPNTKSLFPNTSIPFTTDSNNVYAVVCIAYTDSTNRPYSTKLLYVRGHEGFQLLDAEIK